MLFIDEIHRFNKAQQDALLPHVEAGTVVLIGATTENPSFEVNAALLSRAKVVVLRALSEADLRAVIDRALADKERGLGAQPLDVPDDVRDLVAREARGDARRALVDAGGGGRRRGARRGTAQRKLLTPAVIEEALQKRTLLYDKAGDEHYGVVSAFIKSMRGSDPDAAVYWMARMLEAGEDPLFVLRRMVIFAAEDVGVADPRALSVATAAVDAFRFIGMPEGLIPMTEAALYLATAPKTNTAHHDVRGGQGGRRRARRAAGARTTSATRPRRSPSSWAGAPATSTRTTSPATTSARSTCPTRSAATSTTSRPTRATKARSPRGSRSSRRRATPQEALGRVSPASG